MEVIGNEESAGREFGGPFVRVPRSLINGSFGQEKRVFSKFEACIDLIQMARYSDSEKKEYIGNKLISWNRGQVAASLRYLSVKWGWSKDKVTRFLELLVGEKMISISTNQGQTVITIIEETDRTGVAEKTGQQQGQQTGQRQGQPNSIPVSVLPLYPDTNKDSDPDADRDSNRTVTRTKQKESSNKDEIKNKKVEIHYGHQDSEFIRIYNEWIAYRKQISKPLKAITIEKQNKELASLPPSRAIEVLEEAMTRGWQGYVLTKNHSNGKSNHGIGKTRTEGVDEYVFATY